MTISSKAAQVLPGLENLLGDYAALSDKVNNYTITLTLL
jgi:hypothetical protein